MKLKLLSICMVLIAFVNSNLFAMQPPSQIIPGEYIITIKNEHPSFYIECFMNVKKEAGENLYARRWLLPGQSQNFKIRDQAMNRFGVNDLYMDLRVITDFATYNINIFSDTISLGKIQRRKDELEEDTIQKRATNNNLIILDKDGNLKFAPE
jgi:hypothetical protein